MLAILNAWNTFLFARRSPVPLALFRAAYGMLVIATVLLLRGDWLAWYGPRAWVSLDAMRALEPGVRLNLFTVLPQDDRWIQAFFWVFLGSAAMLAAGFLTRLNSVIVYLCLASMQQRNLYITHSGDTFLRVAGFFLMFAPAGAALSVDRLIRIWRGKEQPEVPACRLWAQRMIQIELAFLYFATFCWKVQSSFWVQGTALFYVYHLAELERFPLPSWALHPVVLKLGTWCALLLEFSLGTLIWVKRVRSFLLAAGLLFHLFLEYSLNIPMIQWDVLSAYILFLDPAGLHRVWNWISARVGPHLGDPVTVLYDPRSMLARRLVNALRALDVFRRLSFADSPGPQEQSAADHPGSRRGQLFLTPSGAVRGRDGWRPLARALPALWPLLPLCYVLRVWHRQS